MTTDSWIALGVLIVTIGVLVIDRLPPVVVLGAAVAALLFADVISSDVALSGFSSPAPMTIAALYVVAGAATAAGVLAGLLDRLLDRRPSIGMLTATTAAVSAFVPNTPLIALFAPRVVRWSDRAGADASRYLLPLSFASILGGVITIIGTSTNLVVSDLLVKTGQDPLGVFEITAVGLPVAAIGVVVLSTVGTRLLPDRSNDDDSRNMSARRFQIAMRVDPTGPLVGASIEEAGLRNLDGVYLAFIERRSGEGVYSSLPATRESQLAADDICCFVGDANRVIDLHGLQGLESTEVQDVRVTDGPGARVYEAVIGPLSSLVGSSLRTIGFRRRFGGAVMAIHRADEQLDGQLGRIPLRSGDVLLILGDEGFSERWRGHPDFALIAALEGTAPVRRERARLVALIAFAFVAVAAADLVSLFEAALAAAIAVVLVGAVSISEAGRSVNLNVVLTMAVAISLGGAIEASGLAAEAASFIEYVDGLGERGLLLTTIVVTIVLTEVVTNTAAAALMLPIAVAVADDVGVEPRLLAIGVLFGASCSFLSPVGYQTNLMVASLGGYRFTDFTRVGAPLTASTVVIVVLLAPYAF